MVRQLRREDVRVGRHRVRRLMRLMGLEAIYQAPRTSAPHPAHRVYPYLLTGLVVDRPNRVWCADITYIPVQRGFLYLHELTDGFAAERVIDEWIDFYNTERPHSALAGQTPAEVYGAGQPVDMMDKARALPTSPQAQQQQQDVINRILAA